MVKRKKGKGPLGRAQRKGKPLRGREVSIGKKGGPVKADYTKEGSRGNKTAWGGGGFLMSGTNTRASEITRPLAEGAPTKSP